MTQKLCPPPTAIAMLNKGGPPRVTFPTGHTQGNTNSNRPSRPTLVPLLIGVLYVLETKNYCYSVTTTLVRCKVVLGHKQHSVLRLPIHLKMICADSNV